MAKKRKVNNSLLPTKDEVKLFDILFPMIESDLNEIRELSKKKQDEPLNKFKVKMINKKLEKIKVILKNEPTIEFLDLLDEETMPTNSDAVLQISQFINAMNKFHGKFYDSGGIDYGFDDIIKGGWKTND
jgi:hypothetical protein